MTPYPERLMLARLGAAVLLSLVTLVGCFILLIGTPSVQAQTVGQEIATILITAWVSYFAAVTGGSRL